MRLYFNNASHWRKLERPFVFSAMLLLVAEVLSSCSDRKHVAAPPLDRTSVADFQAATEFLYSGPQPRQTGVDTALIERRRVAVLRGRVMNQKGKPLSEVKICILDHPEFGSGRTRDDGLFDMVVNGGGQLTVCYENDGHCIVQRRIKVPWQQFVWLPDIVMVPMDKRVTTVDLNAKAEIQVARGSKVSDEDGNRQATLFFPQGTTTEMVLPNDSTQTLTRLHVRATEFTVGPNGPAAMPGELPANSGYTYAVEFTVDEASKVGAKDVRFSQPLIHYVENFLDFPVGGIVPVGYYDREKAAWIPSDNGRIIKILKINSDMAEVDVDGSGVAADSMKLNKLGITEAECHQLANLYASGQSLWRVPIPHFSPWDCNWPYGPPTIAEPPKRPQPKGDVFVDVPCSIEASLADCPQTVLGDSIKIDGTPFSLHYRSDWVPGRLSAYVLNIALSGDSIPDSVKSIDLEICIAGQRHTQSFPLTPNQSYTYTWDGKDAYGRVLHGRHPIHLRIGYVYQAVYQEPAQFEQSFGRFSGIPIEANKARQEITLWQVLTDTLGTWDAQMQGLGGWTLNVHHAYDPSSKMLYLGNGRMHGAESMGHVITTVAGNGIKGYNGDGGSATKAALSEPRDGVVAPDGTIYIADTFNHRIRRVSSNGIITTAAGNGTAGYGGDGGPSTKAQLNQPWSVALGSDGSLYISDSQNNRIRRVTSDGVITTVAGNGTQGYSGDGGPAPKAELNTPHGITVGADGNCYFADINNHCIRRIGLDGTITTVAGNGIAGHGGDGGPANEAQFRHPCRLSAALDGSLYISDNENNLVRHLRKDGIIETVVGNGIASFGGILANEAWLNKPVGVAVGPEGVLYIAEVYDHCIRRIGTDGIIMTAVGSRIPGFGGDGGPANKAQLHYPMGVFLGPDGSLYIADCENHRIRKVTSPLPGTSIVDLHIPTDDDSAVCVFNYSGRHLRTLNAHTGAALYHFGYDSSGFLVQIKDSDGKVTQIERDTSGNPTAIIGPARQRTTLNVDANGYLSFIETPTGEATQLGYSEKGLLTDLTDAKGNFYRFVYDELGHLIRGTKTQAVAQLPLQARTPKLALK